MSSLIIGGRRVRVVPDMVYGTATLFADGPRLHKQPHMLLRCTASLELIEDLSAEVQSEITRQFDEASEQAFRRYATMSERKMRRYARRNTLCS